MQVARDGFVEAMHTGLWIGVAVAVLGAVVAATKLPGHAHRSHAHTAHAPVVDAEPVAVGAAHH